MSRSGSRSKRGAIALVFSARLRGWARIEVHASGIVFAVFDTDSISLGKFGAAAIDSLGKLRAGLPLSALEGEAAGKELELLVRRLAGHGLLEYPVSRGPGAAEELVIVEPQIPGYWPQKLPALHDDDVVALSRFAYIRRRGETMVLESPRADTLFRLCDPGLASSIARLSIPRRVGDLAREGDPTAAEFLTLLVGSHFAFKIEPGNERNLRLAEGDPELVRWDFHDLLFHVQSTEGRHTNPIGAVYPLGITAAPLPALRPSWPGKKTDLAACPASQDEPPIARLLRERHSTRSFDDRRPITIAQLAEFLNGAARVLPQHSGASVSEHAARPYPSAGGSWELELYLAVNLCDGLAQGFYHYDAGNHALVRIEIPAKEMKSLLMGAAGAMGVTSVPQVLFVIAARFGRISWKYSSIAYSLILKDVGVLTQTLYLMAEGMGLGGCAIGLSNIDQFEKMTGIEFYAEGPVGQFALGSKTTS